MLASRMRCGGELLQARTHVPTRGLGREQTRYIGPRSRPLRGSLAVLGIHPAHQLDRVCHAWLRPLSVGRIDLAIRTHPASRVVDQVAVLGTHEIDIPRVAGSDR